MSKYTEAIERLKAEERLTCATCMHPQEVGYCEKYCRIREVYALAVEALQIADRLEQADVTKCEDDYYNYYDSEYGQGYENGFQHGYNAALADIRGDNNDD